MNNILGLLFLCAAPFIGAYLGKRIFERGWLSNRMRVFFASLPIGAFCAWLWLALSQPWAAIAIALVGLFALREGRSYPIPASNFGGLGPYGDYRPRVSDGATWGDVHHRNRNIIPFSQKSDLREMQEGALGSIGSASGKRFEKYPPVIHRQRPGHARLIVDNGHFPPKGKSAKRGQLKSVK